MALVPELGLVNPVEQHTLVNRSEGPPQTDNIGSNLLGLSVSHSLQQWQQSHCMALQPSTATMAQQHAITDASICINQSCVLSQQTDNSNHSQLRPESSQLQGPQLDLIIARVEPKYVKNLNAV